MPTSLRSGLAVAAAAVLTAGALAQTPPAGNTPAPAAGGTAAAKAAPADPVLATVNKEPIYQSEAARLLSQFSIPPGSEQRAYDSAMDLLINTKLLGQFLRGQRIAVSPAEIDPVVEQYRQNLKESKSSLEDELAANNTTMDEFRDRIARTLQWKKFVMARATDAELKKYVETNKDVFNGTQVRASHILVRTEPNTSAADKEKALAKIKAIQQEIQAGKISFADAANKYSEDPGNQQTPAGGDLNFFPRKGQFIEPFAAAAFAMKKGEISDPIETEYGYHLIHVTDRREGQPLEFAKIKDQVLNQYAAELQEQIVTAERKKAEAARAIAIAPMPAGLIKPEIPTSASAPAAPAAGTTKAAAPRR